MNRYIPSWVRVPLIFFIILGILEFFIDSGNQPAFLKYPILLLFLLLVLLILVATEAIVSSLNTILFNRLSETEQQNYLATQNKKPKFIAKLQNIQKKLWNSKPIEQEGEILLDHNYDGIKELNNDLPPWWLYGFYATIIFAGIYLLRYDVLNGKDQYEELEEAYAEAKIEIENYKKTAKNLVDYNTVEVLTESADLAKGKQLFNDNCIACHKADGGGGIGPNLTDSYWILGGGIKNVFKTISEGGRDGKGMVAWKNSLKPLEIAQVASYVLQFQGTTPAAPKAPEGEIWQEKKVTE